MSATNAPAAALSFAKAKPWAFALMAIVVIVVTLRWSGWLRAKLTSIPVAGGIFQKLIG